MKGTILEGNGLIHKNSNTKIVHLTLDAGEEIKPHNHTGKSIYFMVMEGYIDVFLDNSETHSLRDGDILMFDGDTMISAKAKEKCNIYIFLINKENQAFS